MSNPSHADDLRHQQRAVQSNEKKAQQDLDGSSAAYRKAQAHLAAVQKQLTSAKWRVTTVELALRKAQARNKTWQIHLAAARTRLADAQKDLTASQQAVAAQRKIVTANTVNVGTGESSSASQMEALLGSHSMADMTAAAEYGAIYSQMQSSIYDKMTAAEQKLAVRQQQVAGATQAVASNAAQAAAQVAAVKHLQVQAVAARTQVIKLLRTAQKAAHAAHQIALHDQAALNALKAQESSIIARIMAQSGRDAHITGVSSSGMISYPLLGGGVLTSPYGYRINPIWGYWGLHDGDDFAGPCGTPEVAVRSGRVASEYYSSVWGNRLFLDLGYIDGHNFTAIYNHIDRYAVATGAVVTRGQTVAYEGTTGWSTGCHIHFTLMRDGVAVNPMSYIR